MRLTKYFQYFFLLLILSKSMDCFSQQVNFSIQNDTVCVNEPVEIINNTTGASSYKWIFESAVITPGSDVNIVPNVTIPATSGNDGPAFMTWVKDNDKYYTFTTKRAGPAALYKQEYGNSIDNTPINTELLTFSSNSIEGIDIEKDVDGNWYGFVTSGVNTESTKLIRLRFGNSIDNIPVVEELSFSYIMSFPHEIILIYENNYWYAFIANEWNPGLLTVLKFNNGLGSTFENIRAVTFDKSDLAVDISTLSGISVIKDNGAWSVFGVSVSDSKLLRIDFEDDFMIARGFDLGNLDGLLKNPRDITIVSDCDLLRGFAINKGDTSMSILNFPFGSKGEIIASKKSFNDSIVSPHAISDIYRVGSDAIAIFCDGVLGKLIKLRFTANTGHVNSPYPDENVQFPASYSYNAANKYYVSLLVNNDVSSTSCHSIDVIEKPQQPIISNKNVCFGDTLKLAAYAYPGIKYTWTFPDNSISHEQYPKINLSGNYKVKLSYDACHSIETSEIINIVPNPITLVSPDTFYACPNKIYNFNAQNSGGSKPYLTHLWNSTPGIVINKQELENATINTLLLPYNDSSHIAELDPIISLGVKQDLNYGSELMMLDGNTYYKGYGAGSDDTITIKINKKYNRFVCEIGIDDDIFNCANVIFKIIGDKSELFNSGYLTYNSSRRFVDIDVTNIDELKLITRNDFNPSWCDYANWANPILIKQGIHPEQKLFYKVTDSNACSDEGEAVIMIDTTIFKRPIASSNQIICEGLNVGFSVSSPQEGLYIYNWQHFENGQWQFLKNSNRIIGSNTANLNISPTILADSGKYRCFISFSKCDSVFTNEVSLTIKSKPKINDIINLPVKHCLKPDGSIQVNASSANTIYYRLNSNMTNNNLFSNLAAGNYSIYVSNADGSCSDSVLDIPVSESCIDKIYYSLCNNIDTFDLFQALPDVPKMGAWSDSSSTLHRIQNLVSLRLVSEGSYLFTYQFNDTKYLLSLNVYAYNFAGGPQTVNSCNNTFNLRHVIDQTQASTKGSWYQNGIQIDSMLVLEKGLNEILYITDTNFSCPSDTSAFKIILDTIPPVISCDLIQNKSYVFFNDLGNTAFTDELYRPESKDECGIASLMNSLSSDSTLMNKNILPGEYTIMWVASDFAGNLASCESSLTIKLMDIPNLFSPNGDGLNDTWDFDIEANYPDAIIFVFNRSGEIIYSSEKGYPIKWNGTSNGKVVDSDGYYYIIESNKKAIHKGTVTIMR